MIDGLAVARAVHVVAVVHWIGGLLFVTLVILPSLLETEAPRRLAVFDALERRFATQARLSTLLVGLSASTCCMPMSIGDGSLTHASGGSTR